MSDRNFVPATGKRPWIWTLLGVALAFAGLELFRRMVRGVAYTLVFVAMFVLVAVSGPRRARAEAPPEGRIVIENVHLIDGTGAPPRVASVAVEAGRIVEVGSSMSSEAKTRIDASAKYLVPGFIDTHAHVGLGPVGLVEVDGSKVLGSESDEAIATRSLRTLLASGVTTIRDPGGPARVLVDLRERQRRGEIVGPRLVVAGEVIDRLPFAGLSTRVESPEDVRREVRRQAEVGVDWIKLYTTLEPELLAAGVEEAKLHGLQVAAHLERTSWTEASRLGVDSLLHIVPGSPELLPVEKRARLEESLPGAHTFYRWFELVDFESPEIRELIRTLKENGTFVDPTMVAFESIFLGGVERREGLADLELVSPALLENWRSFFHFNIGWTEEHFRAARQAWPKVLEFLRLLYDSGVLLTAGTDANNPWVVPGPSYHRELEIFSEVGIPALEVLGIATRNGARALRLDDQIGTIEVGKRADLVLLSEDPTVEITSTRAIEWVMQEGRRYHPEELLEPLEATGSTSGSKGVSGSESR